jgi:autotransporter strand-loop-strand O-heptosyltransferase
MLNELNIKLSFVTRLPLEGNNPSIYIESNINTGVTLRLYDIDKDMELVSTDFVYTNGYFSFNRQWYTKWFIQIEFMGHVIFEYKFDLQDKVVFIKFDSHALCDKVAWIPYVEEFRLKHKCKIVCSTFFNNLLVDSYPDIMFTQPNVQIDNVYAQYYIRAING